jgi:hypothetical protein
VFNDPTFIGWLATGMYVAAAALCAIAARSPATRSLPSAVEQRHIARFWWLLAAGLLLLAFNKQIDLQTAITDRLRHAAQRDGWYGSRRALQVLLVGFALGLCALGAWGVKRLLGRHWRTHRLVLAGVGILLVYLLLRVADIERLGEMTGLPLEATGVRDALEWIGLILIAAAAWRRAATSS